MSHAHAPVKRKVIVVSGISPLTVFAVFLVLKLVGVIGWSWWWVTAPLWLPVVACFALWSASAILFGIGFGLILLWNRR